jgi:hypothetical protein
MIRSLHIPLCAFSLVATSCGDGSSSFFDGPPVPPDPPMTGEMPRPGAAAPRSDFRETVYVNPSIITDASGRASVTVPLADSITTWRVSADASSAGGRIGSARHSVRTFQPFFVDLTLPTDLTTGDEIEIPAVVYNYLESAQEVTVSLADARWFEPLTPANERIELAPSEVRAVKFRIRVVEAGPQSLELRGEGSEIADALVRSMQVTPEGEPQDQSFSGRLESRVEHAIEVPALAVPGGTSCELVLTPGFAAEAVQGLDSMLREPNGCFEQTTSTAWPNTLVARYLDASGQLTDERRESTIALVTRGYQRLLTFESPTGGFNWWGDSTPGNRILSAIFLWHLKDLEGLIAIDEAVRDRTLSWLLAQQEADGSFAPGDALHAGNESLGTDRARTTAFIAWALAHTGWADDALARSAEWLERSMPEGDLYATALAANALAMADPDAPMAQALLASLDAQRIDHEDGSSSWPTTAPSWTGSSGDVGAVETTGLVSYAFSQAGVFHSSIDQALDFLVSRKDSVGTWYNTQATMNALRAMSAAAASRSDANGVLRVFVDGELAHEIAVDDESRELVRRFEVPIVDRSRVVLEFTGAGSVAYRLTRRIYVPSVEPREVPIDLDVSYDRTSLLVGESVRATVVAVNNDAGTRDQVIVRVGRAPGFVPDTADLDAIVARGAASRYEVRATDVTFYLMGLGADESRDLSFRLTPNLAVTALAPASSIYPYYDPSLERTLEPIEFDVSSR